MMTLTLRNLRAHQRRLMGTGLAVVLGVAFLASTLILGDTMRESFRGLFGELTAETDVAVRNRAVIGSADHAERGPTPTDVVERLAAVDGVALASPEVTGAVQVVDASGDPLGGGGPPTLASNWLAEDVNPMVLREGRAPEGPGEVVIDRASARDGALAVGDTTTVRTPAPVEVEVVGHVTLGDLDTLSGTTYVAFDTATATELFGREGEVSSVLLRAEPGVSPEELRDRVAAQLDDLVPDRTLQALTGTELADEAQADAEGDFLGVVNNALLVFAGIALLVAGFSIHNTFSIVVAQRSREAALLRAIGSSRRQILGAVVLEALAIGVVASAIGVVAGYGLALALKAVLGSVGLELVVSGVVVSGAAVAVALGVGIAATLASAVAPAVRASRVAPVAAMRDLAVDHSATARSRAVAGTALTATGVALVAGGAAGDGSVPLAGLGALATVIGAVVLGPVVARPVTALIGAPVSLLGGTTGRLARRNAARDPRRTAGSASALLVGVAVVALMAAVGASVKTSISNVVDERFGGDLGIDSGFGSVDIAPAVAEEVAALDVVDDAVGIRTAVLTLDGRDELPAVTEAATLERLVDLGVSEGSVTDLAAGEIAVSDGYADRHDLGVGDTMAVAYADGSSAEVQIAARYGSDDILGPLLLTAADWTPHAPTGDGDAVVLVDLAGGVALEAGQEAVQAVSDAHGGPTVQNRERFVESVAAEVDQLLYLVYGLLGLAVLIALMGIANTLSLAVFERTRELGLLRAVGQSRRQLRATVRWESVITAVFGTVGGIGLGTFLGWGLVRSLTASEGLGAFTVPTPTLVVVTVLAAVAGVVAAIRPARRAARLDILEAVAAS